MNKIIINKTKTNSCKMAFRTLLPIFKIMKAKKLVAAKNFEDLLTQGKIYEVENTFDTPKAISGKCIVVQDNRGNFTGFDTSFFE